MTIINTKNTLTAVSTFDWIFLETSSALFLTFEKISADEQMSLYKQERLEEHKFMLLVDSKNILIFWNILIA